MGFLSPFVRGQTCMWALPRVWRREADTTSCVADYLTRSVRRASGFVLADHSSRIAGSAAPKDTKCGLHMRELLVLNHWSLATAVADRSPVCWWFREVGRNALPGILKHSGGGPR